MEENIKKYINEYYIPVLKNYTNFEGLATREQFWKFVLINTIISILLGIISGIVNDKHGMLGALYSLAMIIPSIAVATRRLHDIEKSGWWQLLSLIPIIGWVWLIILLATPTKNGNNKYK